MGAVSSRLPIVSVSLFRRLSAITLGLVALIVLTGAGVRLTGSGLGCSDWPDCTRGHLTPALHFHSMIEFSNRMVTVVLVIAVAITFLAALRRRPYRRDLVWLSAGLVVGILAEAVVGGIVVYTKLNPYVVSVHFLATMLLLVNAVVLLHRSDRDYRSGSGHLLVPRAVLWFYRGVIALLGVVIIAGSATTGTAPDAGGASGQLVAKRIPVSLRTMTEIHAGFALLLLGMTIGLVVVLMVIDVPERVRKAGRILLIVMAAQAGVGYTQFFTHLPAVLVEIHELGVTVLLIGVTQSFMAITFHGPEVGDESCGIEPKRAVANNLANG